MLSRDEILSEIRRLASANDGKPVGRERFLTETSVKAYDIGRYWARWNDAILEAGLSPNAMQSKSQTDNSILRSVAELTLELGHFPTTPELRLKRHADPTFPSANTIRSRIGTQQDLRRRVTEFAAANSQYESAVELCKFGLQNEEADESANTNNYEWVYLIRMDKWYKVGKTNNLTRRQAELGRQLPEEGQEIHRIKTDDPFGVEAYWLRRFESRKTMSSKSDWFLLTPSDVKAFKRWIKIY